MPDASTQQTVTVKLFAAARDAVGDDCVHVQLAKGAMTVGDLRRALVESHPQLVAIVAHSMFAVDEEYRTDSDQVPASATVACIPPVSGG